MRTDMKIKTIKIEKLYGKYDFSWELSGDVNVIAGDNGAYKTTLLKIMSNLCEPEAISEEYVVKGASLALTDNVMIKFRSFRDSLLRLKKDAENDEMLAELIAKVQADIDGKDEKSLSDHTLSASIIAIRQGNKRLSIGNYKRLRRYNLIATFDVPITKSEKDSILDLQLKQLESEYAYYLSDLSKQLSDRIQKVGNVDLKDMQSIYAHNKKFIDIVNKAFENTNKTIDTTQSKLQFKLNDDLLENNKRLSSGEKQFLIIMLTVLLQRNEESILIMDEPEISMHLDWQRSLIHNIKVLNPNCQIILATHSPGVVMDGWEQLVTNISELFTVKE